MTQQPDIVWIVVDHQVHAERANIPGFYALQDRLAKAGTSFSYAHTVLPICSPARASMLTALYPHAHGLTENDGRFGGRDSLSPDEWMVHWPLLESGYRCAWFGKWHVDNQRGPHEYHFEGDTGAGYGYLYQHHRYADYRARYGLPIPVARVEVPGESRVPVGT